MSREHTGEAVGDEMEGGPGQMTEKELGIGMCRDWGNVLKWRQQEETHGGSKERRDAILLRFGI